MNYLWYRHGLYYEWVNDTYTMTIDIGPGYAGLTIWKDRCDIENRVCFCMEIGPEVDLKEIRTKFANMIADFFVWGKWSDELSCEGEDLVRDS